MTNVSEADRLQRLFERDRAFGRQHKQARGMLEHLTLMISSKLTLCLPLETGDALNDHAAVLTLFRSVVASETAKTFQLYGIESSDSEVRHRRCTAIGPDGIRCGGIIGHSELHHALIESSLLNEPGWRDA